jgi:hypothetical protein
MFEQIVTPDAIGTYYATEHAKLPGLECPRCEAVNPLGKLVADKECENCGKSISLRMKVGITPELSKGAELVLGYIQDNSPLSKTGLNNEMKDRRVGNQKIDEIVSNLEEKEFIDVEDGTLYDNND